jgi:ParB family chromosome partitioning protein
MADHAQELLTGSGWLPEPLRTPGRVMPVVMEAPQADGDQPATPDNPEAEPTAEDWPTAAE